MITRRQKAASALGSVKVEKNAASSAGRDSDSACRCKETSEMTPRELLRLMLRDLSIWKKMKKG